MQMTRRRKVKSSVCRRYLPSGEQGYCVVIVIVITAIFIVTLLPSWFPLALEGIRNLSLEMCQGNAYSLLNIKLYVMYIKIIFVIIFFFSIIREGPSLSPRSVVTTMDSPAGGDAATVDGRRSTASKSRPASKIPRPSSGTTTSSALPRWK